MQHIIVRESWGILKDPALAVQDICHLEVCSLRYYVHVNIHESKVRERKLGIEMFLHICSSEQISVLQITLN